MHQPLLLTSKEGMELVNGEIIYLGGFFDQVGGEDDQGMPIFRHFTQLTDCVTITRIETRRIGTVEPIINGIQEAIAAEGVVVARLVVVEAGGVELFTREEVVVGNFTTKSTLPKNRLNLAIREVENY